MTPVPQKTLVLTVQVKFCRAQILGHPALILDLNLTLPPRWSVTPINSLYLGLKVGLVRVTVEEPAKSPRLSSRIHTEGDMCKTLQRLTSRPGCPRRRTRSMTPWTGPEHTPAPEPANSIYTTQSYPTRATRLVTSSPAYSTTPSPFFMSRVACIQGYQ